MLMVYLLFIFCVLFIRIFAGYDSRFQSGKSIVIKNPTLRLLLLDSTSFFSGTKRLKKDINKMSIYGLTYYIVAACVLTVNLVLMFVPPIPTEPWVIETSKFIMYTDTLNKKISAIAIFLLLCAVFGWMAVLITRFSKESEKGWIKILIYSVALITILTVIFFSAYMLKELVCSFI